MMGQSDVERQKLLDAVAYFSGNTKYCGLVKLFKLLYYLDMLHFRETGRNVTGLDYSAWQYGPVPSELFRESKQPSADLASVVRIERPSSEIGTPPKSTRITPLGVRGVSHLTAREKRIASQLVEMFRDCTAEQISDISHAFNGPWDKARRKGEGSPIDPFDSVNLKFGTGQAVPLDELHERAEEYSEARRLYG